MRVLVIVLAALFCQAQTSPPQDRLVFEVASIRPTTFPSGAFAAGFLTARGGKPCSEGAMSISGTRVSLEKVSVCDVIRIAYNLKDYEIFGAPPAPKISLGEAVALGEKPLPGVAYIYDIEARAPGSAPPDDAQAREMLRTLLTDRCKLRVHIEKRVLDYYAQVAGKNGPKLTPAKDDCKPLRDMSMTSACNQSMERLAKMFARSGDRPVLDETGVTEKFQYQFPIDPNETNREAAQRGAILEGLHLKLESRKGPMDALVIDHVEPPTAN